MHGTALPITNIFDTEEDDLSAEVLTADLPFVHDLRLVLDALCPEKDAFVLTGDVEQVWHVALYGEDEERLHRARAIARQVCRAYLDRGDYDAVFHIRSMSELEGLLEQHKRGPPPMQGVPSKSLRQLRLFLWIDVQQATDLDAAGLAGAVGPAGCKSEALASRNCLRKNYKKLRCRCAS